jgi:hypothetical protein
MSEVVEIAIERKCSILAGVGVGDMMGVFSPFQAGLWQNTMELNIT